MTRIAAGEPVGERLQRDGGCRDPMDRDDHLVAGTPGERVQVAAFDGNLQIRRSDAADHGVAASGRRLRGPRGHTGREHLGHLGVVVGRGGHGVGPGCDLLERPVHPLDDVVVVADHVAIGQREQMLALRERPAGGCDEGGVVGEQPARGDRLAAHGLQIGAEVFDRSLVGEQHPDHALELERGRSSLRRQPARERFAALRGDRVDGARASAGRLGPRRDEALLEQLLRRDVALPGRAWPEVVHTSPDLLRELVGRPVPGGQQPEGEVRGGRELAIGHGCSPQLHRLRAYVRGGGTQCLY